MFALKMAVKLVTTVLSCLVILGSVILYVGDVFSNTGWETFHRVGGISKIRTSGGAFVEEKDYDSMGRLTLHRYSDFSHKTHIRMYDEAGNETEHYVSE